MPESSIAGCRMTRSGWCGIDVPLGDKRHDKCVLAGCPCEHHKTPAAEGAPGDASTTLENPATGSGPTTSAAGPDQVKITEPGVYLDLPAHDYHAQEEWLSWSRMKNLIPPSTPAHFRAALRRPQERKRHFDLGKVVHAVILGEGDDFEIVQAARKDKTLYDATSYDLVSAQRHRDEIYESGKVPILRAELDAAMAMADSVSEHREAHALLTNGTPEVSLFWVDEATGVRCRARLDWLPEPPASGRRMIVPDLKSALSAAPSEFSKAAAKYGYYGQQKHYLDGIRACGLADDPAFVFVVVEKADPWPVIVGQIAKQDDLILADRTVDHARRLYRDCLAVNAWPAYPGGVIDLSLPMWLHYDLEDFIA